jgi:integrase
VCRLAGIEHATPHSTRHTYASRLLTAGVPIARVSKLLGHSSIQVTERVYAHLIDDAHDEVRAALEGWQGGETTDRTSWRRPRAI